jgi:hypothetical protein
MKRKSDFDLAIEKANRLARTSDHNYCVIHDPYYDDCDPGDQKYTVCKTELADYWQEWSPGSKVVYSTEN